MPILATLSTALPYLQAAWQVGSSMLNKPKKDDYIPKGGMYERYKNNLMSQTAESRVYNQSMRGMSRQVGAQQKKGSRAIEQFAAKNKPGGGIEAQLQLGLNKQALETLGIAHEKAMDRQELVNERTGEQLMRIGMQEERQLQAYNSAKQQHTKNVISTGVSAGLNLASSAVQKHLADSKTALEAAEKAGETAAETTKQYELAKAGGLLPTIIDSEEKYVDWAKENEYENFDVFNKYRETRAKNLEENLKVRGEAEAKQMKAGSADALAQYKRFAAENPEAGFDMLMETGYMEYMTPEHKVQAANVAKSNMPKIPLPSQPMYSEYVDLWANGETVKAQKMLNKIINDPKSSTPYVQKIATLQNQLNDRSKSAGKALTASQHDQDMYNIARTNVKIQFKAFDELGTKGVNKAKEFAPALKKINELLDSAVMKKNGKGGVTESILTGLNNQMFKLANSISVEGYSSGYDFFNDKAPESPSQRQIWNDYKTLQNQVYRLATKQYYDDRDDLLNQTQQ